MRSESRGQTCLHYAEPRGRKDCGAGLTESGELRTEKAGGAPYNPYCPYRPYNRCALTSVGVRKKTKRVNG